MNTYTTKTKLDKENCRVKIPKRIGLSWKLGLILKVKDVSINLKKSVWQLNNPGEQIRTGDHESHIK